MMAVRVHAPGGPDALRYEEVPTPLPGEREALVRIEAIGVNFIDIYHRTGLYKLATPFIPGQEAAGIVDTIGPGVTEVKPGDRVAYASHPGAYAEYAAVPAWKLVAVPPGVGMQTAAALMLQGMTAHYLTHSTFPLRRGDRALVHAAAGGLGLLLVQTARRCGATVFGTVSTEEKARLAQDAGADHVIRYTEADFEAEVKRLSGNGGLDVVSTPWAGRPIRRVSTASDRVGCSCLSAILAGQYRRSTHLCCHLKDHSSSHGRRLDTTWRRARSCWAARRTSLPGSPPVSSKCAWRERFP